MGLQRDSSNNIVLYILKNNRFKADKRGILIVFNSLFQAKMTFKPQD